MQRRAIYPGSFDPPTLGHVDVIERAARLFDEVIVGIGANSSKEPFFSVQQRQQALEACCSKWPNVRVQRFDGLLIEFAKRLKVGVLVRGLRATSDFDYEFQIAMANRRLAPEVETVFLMTKWEHSFLSSSVVREIATLGGDYTSFVPAEVAGLIKERLETLRVKMQGT